MVFLGPSDPEQIHPPKVRIYQTNNLYSALVRQSQLEQRSEADCEKRQKDRQSVSSPVPTQSKQIRRKGDGDSAGKGSTDRSRYDMFRRPSDGLCRLEGGTFSKTIAFEDVNYRLAGPEDQREHL